MDGIQARRTAKPREGFAVPVQFRRLVVSAVADHTIGVGGIGADFVPSSLATVGIRVADQRLAFRVFTSRASIGGATVT